MKKLFLASIAFRVLDKVLPLLPDKPKNLKLAFVPTASNIYEDRSWMKKDQDKLIEMGFTVIDLDIEGKTKEEVEAVLSNVDVLFVAGGNTFYLLEKAKESGFIDLAKEFIQSGKVYIGSSAGAAFVCPTIGYAEGMDDSKVAPSLTNYDALNVVPFLVMPHYGDEDYKDAMGKNLKIWKDKGYEFKLITNDEALIVEGDDRVIVSAKNNIQS